MKEAHTLLIIALGLLLLLALYVGSWLALVETLGEGRRYFVYRIAWDSTSNDCVSRFYRPLEWIDRKVNPVEPIG